MREMMARFVCASVFAAAQMGYTVFLIAVAPQDLIKIEILNATER